MKSPLCPTAFAILAFCALGAPLMHAQTSNDLRVQGDEKYHARDYDGAVAAYSEAIRLDPTNSVAFTNRGSAKKAKGDLDGAIADENEAIRLNPQAAIAF